MSLLLRLPRELRDQIYMCALYEADGLIYTENRNGIASLCRRSSKLSARRTFLALLRKGLFHQANVRRKLCRSEVNQLKYVCKQLYRETKGIALPQNHVILKDSSTLNAMDQCIPLLQHWSMLRRVVIRCSSRAFESDHGKEKLRAIIKYCNENTTVSVRVHIPYWSQEDLNFVLRGLSYLFALRGDSSLIAQLARVTSVSYLSDTDSEQVKMNTQIPSNVRWIPREEKFDRSLFERNVRRNPLLGSPSAQSAIAGLKELVEGWFIYGL